MNLLFVPVGLLELIVLLDYPHPAFKGWRLWTVWKEGEYSNQTLGKQFHDASGEGIITSFGKISNISGESKETPIRSLLASTGAGVGVGSTSGEQVGEVCLRASKRPSLSLFSQESRFLEDCLSEGVSQACSSLPGCWSSARSL